MKPHFHCLSAYKPTGTNSFRLAAGMFLGIYGTNLQNPDHDSLECFEAPVGYSFIQPDQSGAEALIVAHLTKPGRYRELFSVGIKPHTFVALHIFAESKQDTWPMGIGKNASYWKALSPSELAADPDWKALDKAIKSSDKEYKIGKMVCHAASYKMRERTFQLQALKQSQGTLVLSFQECKVFLGFFASLFPEIIEWQDEVEFTVRSQRKLRNLFDYPREFNRLFNDSYIREAISWIPQSTVGCITHKAIHKFNLTKPRHIQPAVNNKHDSYLPMAPDADVPEIAALSRSCMAIDLVGRDGAQFTMRSEVQVGKNWGKFHPEKNPNGMKEYKMA